MKQCIKCHLRKPEKEFYRYSGKCKMCIYLYNKERKKRLGDKILAYHREYYYSHPEKFKNRDRRKYKKSYQKTHADKYKAQQELNKAVRRGEIKRLPCERCGGKAHGHHEDYSKPLEVKWLCALHHAERHRVLASVVA